MSIRAVRAAAFVAALASTTVTTAEAQRVRLTPTLVSLTHAEIGEDLEFSGIGGGLVASYRAGRFGVSGEGVIASLASGDQAVTASSYRVALFDVRATYGLLPGLDAVLGAQSRSVAPEFAAQDVGVIRIGLATGTPTSISSLLVISMTTYRIRGGPVGPIPRRPSQPKTSPHIGPRISPKPLMSTSARIATYG